MVRKLTRTPKTIPERQLFGDVDLYHPIFDLYYPIFTYEQSAKDDKKEGGNTEYYLCDIDFHVDQGQHTVVENHRDAVVEEGLAEHQEVEAGVHLEIVFGQLPLFQWNQVIEVYLYLLKYCQDCHRVNSSDQA